MRRGTGGGRHVFKVQILQKTLSTYRSFKGKHLIDERKVSEAVIREARLAAETYRDRASFQDIVRVKAATVQCRNAYDIRGWCGD